MPQPKYQYLSASNTYQARLIALGNAGLPWIVECTDDGAEPEYEGFADEMNDTGHEFASLEDAADFLRAEVGAAWAVIVPAYRGAIVVSDYP